MWSPTSTEIHRYNPQRFEMEQFTAIVFEDPAPSFASAIRISARDEFWARGHMPGMPLMPGVIMCEAAAQLSSYFAVKNSSCTAWWALAAWKRSDSAAWCGPATGS